MKQLIPVTELPNLYGEGTLTGDENITWDFHLPGYLDAERIVLDSAHLRRIQKIAGFSTNHVVSYDGEKPEVQPAITGIAADGTALAGFISLAKETIRSRQELVDGYTKDLMTNYFDTAVRNELDKSQIISKIIKRRERMDDSRTTNEQLWAEEIDTYLQLSIRRAARKHLLGRGMIRAKVGEALNDAVIAGAIVYNTMIGDVAVTAVFAGTFAIQRAILIAHESGANYAQYGETFLRNRRWSLFMEMQPDRYLALDALTRVNSLIKVKK
jgi:hypothetical protein